MVRTGLRTLVILISVAIVGAFIDSGLRQLALARTADPVESALLARTEHFAHHEPVYAEPSRAAAPSLMPGLPLAASALGGESGPGLGDLRWLALGLALVLALVVAVTVYVETASSTLGLAAAAATLLGQGFLAGSATALRPEIPLLILAVTAFLMLRTTEGVGGALLAALLLGAAYFVDQRAAWYIAAALAVLALEDRAQLAAFALVTALVVGGGFLLLSRALGPWFNYDAWDAPLAALRPSLGAPARYLGGQLLGMLGFWTLAALLACALPSHPLPGKGSAWLWMAAAAALSGVLATQNGAAGSALLPALVTLAILGTISVQKVARHLSAWPGSTRQEGETTLLAAVILQLVAVLAAVPPESWLR